LFCARDNYPFKKKSNWFMYALSVLIGCFVICPRIQISKSVFVV
jgi:hypothetical protein